ncbi:unnamed protein product [Fusarium langsethiae]|nr:unnamed protein product [Fusarium langsethiae]
MLPLSVQLALGLSRFTAFLVVIANRVNCVWQQEEHDHTSGECPLEYFLCSACARTGHHFFNCTTKNEDDLAEEFSGYEIIRDVLCAKSINRDSAAKSAKNTNRCKFLNDHASHNVSQHPDRYTCVQSFIDRIKNGTPFSEKQNAAFDQQVKTLYHDTVREFSGIVIATPAACASLLVQKELQPDLVIIDDASTMTTATTDPIIAHFTPKAWVFAGDVFLKPFEHDEVDGDYVD